MPLGPCVTLVHSSVSRLAARDAVAVDSAGRVTPVRHRERRPTRDRLGIRSCTQGTLRFAMPTRACSPGWMWPMRHPGGAVATARRTQKVYLVFCNLCNENVLPLAAEGIGVRRQQGIASARQPFSSPP
jgi:hypothetical protein